MKRLLLALVPWMAMTSAARAQAPADVVFTHLGVVNERCVRVDDECFVPLSFPTAVGWNSIQKGDNVEIVADGQHVRVGTREIAGQQMLPLKFIADKLGAETTWDGDHFNVLAPLTQVQIRKGHFTIESNLPIKPRFSVLDNPDRVVIDLQGAKLTRRTNVELDGTSRIGQYKPDVVRVVLETSGAPQSNLKKLDPGKKFEFDVAWSEPAAQPSTPTKQTDPPPPVAQSGPKVPLTQPQQIQYDPASNPDMIPPTAASFTTDLFVGPLTMNSESDKAASISLKLSRPLEKMPVFRRPDADVIEMVLIGGKVADGADFSLVKGGTIQNATTREENGNLIVRLDLVRPMGLEFSLSGASLQIELIKPDVGNGHLAGKVVVVDAGHGGHDNGTQSTGVSEKNLTLAIAKLLSQKLANEGATVIMTRKTDVFIPLGERPSVANRNGADFFVSVHINSNELDNSATGSITFYHAKDPICQLMADCIQREIVKVNGIGGMGVWSDQKIYGSGFAVLRGAKMPAVLVECGFLNTKKDRARMITDDFQNSVAGAIVKGLKVFLGDEKKD